MLMSRIFSADRHARFAALSGDFNPIHVDALAARRTLAGERVVHGVHTLLWLLDCIAEQCPDLPAATALKVRFGKMVYVEERVDAEIISVDPTALRARALIDGVEAIGLTVVFAPPQNSPHLPPVADSPSIPPPAFPAELSLEQMEGRQGRLQFAATPIEAGAMFPHAARYLGPERIAALACASCLVGMVVPGLHSLFGGLDLRLEEHAGEAGQLEYVVMTVDVRFRLVRLGIRGAGLSGFLATVSRPLPVVQPPMTSIAPLVARDEFRDATALIIGGSRGLGEVTAKLIAAGGGRVIITYRSGEAEAAAVAAQITAWGGDCEIAAYDATQPAEPQLALLRHVPTHLYYFATPPIARRKSGLCDARRLEQFNAYYIFGFLDLAQAAARSQRDGISIFYPSTVYVEERPAEFTEYAMAKAAGELLCADMQKYLSGLRVLVRRLPRMSTDQSSSLVPSDPADPVEVMLPIARQMHRKAQVEREDRGGSVMCVKER